MLQHEYYVIERENNDHYPLFAWDQAADEFGLGVPATFQPPVKIRLRDPISPKFELVDYHQLPDPVVSPKLAKALAPLNIHGIQLVPAVVRNPSDPYSELHEYFFIHVWNRIACLDKDNSELECNRDGTRIFGIQKLVLDENVLNNISLPKRLIFELEEKPSVLLIHASVKSAIESVSPKGVRFFKATDWNSDLAFD